MDRKSKILVLIEQSQDYKLLTTLLERDYEIISPETFPDETLYYDLIIINGLSHSRYKNILVEEKSRANPLFLPVLILTGKKDVDIAAGFLWKTVDELIVLPVNKTELHARVEMLLRTRKQSIELEYSHSRILKQNQEQLNLAVKAANVGLWDWNLETNKVYFSPEWKKQIGFEDNEISDELREWSDRVHPEDIERCVSIVNDYLKNPWPDYNLEFRFRHKSGTYLWIYTQASLIYNDEGKPVRMLGSHVDITECKKNEAKLKLYTRALEQSPVSLNITDFNGNIIYVNSGFTKLSGYSFEEVVGKKPRFLNSGIQTNEFYKELWETITAGNNWMGELCNKNKNGNLYWVQANISPVFDSKGNITNFVAIKEDITEKKKMVDELIVAKEKAEESDNLKTAFIHNISHEIRTPLNAIVGFSGFLSDPKLSSEKRAQFTDIIIQSSDQLLSIIDDIFKVATLEAGQEKVHIKEFELNSKLQLLYNQYRIKAAKQNIDLKVKLLEPDTQFFITTDETKLTQILSNLISNAIKFTKQGYVNFGYSLKGNTLEFFVEDTGIGIPAQMHDEIFKRFRQVETMVARIYGGSGLGLSISKAYVELMGGKIWLKSEVEKGSTFYFTISHKNPENKAFSERQEGNGSLKEIKQITTLLVAEDEDTNFMLLEELLAGSNIIIIRAINGIEAVEICKTNKEIDLILMDIKMPVMDGCEATKQIRQFLPGLPIIAQTAYTTDTDKNKALMAGCNDFISKPFKQEALISKIKEQLQK